MAWNVLVSQASPSFGTSWKRFCPTCGRESIVVGLLAVTRSQQQTVSECPTLPCTTTGAPSHFVSSVRFDSGSRAELARLAHWPTTVVDAIRAPKYPTHRVCSFHALLCALYCCPPESRSSVGAAGSRGNLAHGRGRDQRRGLAGARGVDLRGGQDSGGPATATVLRVDGSGFVRRGSLCSIQGHLRLCAPAIRRKRSVRSTWSLKSKLRRQSVGSATIPAFVGP